MVCDEIKRVIYFFLDGQLGERTGSDFKIHIGLCHDCDDRVLIQRRLRTFIFARLPRQSAPPHLTERLHKAVASGSA